MTRRRIVGRLVRRDRRARGQDAAPRPSRRTSWRRAQRMSRWTRVRAAKPSAPPRATTASSLRAARRALARAPSVCARALVRGAARARRARRTQVDAVSEVWTRAVVEGPPERRRGVRALLAAASRAMYALRDGATKEQRSAAASALRTRRVRRRAVAPPVRARAHRLKHRDPATTTRLLAALRAVASRATAERAPATHRELRVARGVRARAVLRAMPPPSADPDAPARPAKLGTVRAPAPRRARTRPSPCWGYSRALARHNPRGGARRARAPPRFKRRRRNFPLCNGAPRARGRTTTDDGRVRRDARRRRRLAANARGGSPRALHVLLRRRAHGRAGVGPHRARRRRSRARARRPRRRRRPGRSPAPRTRRVARARARARAPRARAADVGGARAAEERSVYSGAPPPGGGGGGGAVGSAPAHRTAKRSRRRTCGAAVRAARQSALTLAYLVAPPDLRRARRASARRIAS